jgi:alkanesulfonate monooxygenase SsuD/methylene tetrahydromethanopterin reductase-like flavin-dependent oxidoreductase (luciferase family)
VSAASQPETDPAPAAAEHRRPRLGLTLPQFLDDVGPLVAVARAAEESGLDGVFVFDHLFRVGAAGVPRPSQEMAATLGAVVAETDRITVGTLVARVPLRPPAVLAAVFDSARRMAGDRIVAGLGAGDHESRPEHEQFGPPYESVAFRVAQLRAATEAVRATGVPVWIGGRHPDVVALALEAADGWNVWGGDPAEVAARMAVDVGARRAGAGAGAGAERAGERPFTTSWGGVVDLASLSAERLDGLLGVDVDWVVLGARAPGDPADVRRLGALVADRAERAGIADRAEIPGIADARGRSGRTS